jgi:hypothetical protein
MKYNPQGIVYVTKEAYADMYDEVLAYPDLETAWTLYGYYNEAQTVATILGVIRPRSSEVHRLMATTSIGGQWQAQAMKWLMSNWRKLKNYYPPEFYPQDLYFGYLFRGHSHAKLGITHYSGTDIDSMRSIVRDDHLPVAVGPLANVVTHNAKWQRVRDNHGHFMHYDAHQGVDLRFYWLTQNMVNNGYNDPIRVDYFIMDEHGLPIRDYPRLGWQYKFPIDYELQLARLEQLGCKVTVIHRDLPEEKFLKIQFILQKPGWRGTVNIYTDWDFPTTPPTFETVIDGKFTQIFPEGKRNKSGLLWRSYPEDLWTPDKSLADVIRVIEEKNWI